MKENRLQNCVSTMNGVTSLLVSFYDFNVSSYFAMRKSISIYRKFLKYFRDIFMPIKKKKYFSKFFWQNHKNPTS